jgi:hypothetical protein
MTDAGVLPGRRRALWMALLQRLTAASPTWLVWKNVDSALDGEGDIDSAAHPDDWDRLEEQFVAWAGEWGVLPVVQCRHIPGGRNLVAVPDASPTFLELSIKNDKAFRGSTLFVLDDLLAMSEMDPRGFRKLRPGAEGLLKLALNGSRWLGRPNVEGLESKHVRSLLASDREGVAQAAHLFGRAEAAARALADAVVAGGWDRGAMLRIEANALARGLRRPSAVARRVRFRVVTQRRCPIVHAIGHGRLVIEPRRDWIDDVARTHRVYGAPRARTPTEQSA